MTMQIGGGSAARIDRGRLGIPTTMMQRWARRAASLVRAEGGNAAVEFGLAAPLLVALLVPVADLGIAFSQQIQVQQAAQAGAQYATIHPWTSSSPTAISNAVVAATTLSTLAASPAPAQTCGCPTGSQIAAAACTATCSDGQPAGYYVVVSAQAPYTPQLPYSVLGSSVTLAAKSTVRVR
jgi:Flp pilus assembly protein TadG